MFGFKFIKISPTDYVFLIKKGKIKRQGSGLSFFYFAPTSTVSVVPIDTKDQPFIFNVMSKDFQQVSVQGQFSYCIKKPEKIYTLLNFSINEYGEPVGDGIEKLPIRIMNIVQVMTREWIVQYPLIEALTSSDRLVKFLNEQIKENETLDSMGIEVIHISILNISTTPEMTRALETSTREKILQEADIAIYERRNFAVEQERKIKENELQTQIAIEEKNKQILEEKMNAEIAIQEKQKILELKKFETNKTKLEKSFELNLVDIQNQKHIEQEKIEIQKLVNEKLILYSEAKSKSLELELKPLKELSPKLLDIFLQSGMNTKQLIGKAFLNLAKGSSKIGNLNISPELLNALLVTEQKQSFSAEQSFG
ncbi:MAG: SPFH domain-containing protein [Leptonema sp. (in: bacteria)]